MNKCRRIGLALLFVVAGCSELSQPTAPDENRPGGDRTTEVVDVGAPADMGVGTLGVIETIKPQEQGLVLYQTGFDVESGPRSKVNNARHEFAVGARHARLQVHIRDDTQIFIDGDTATVSDLAEGMLVLVVGRVSGASLHAEVITNAATHGPPPEDLQTIVPAALLAPRPKPQLAQDPTVSATSRCLGQPFSFSDSATLAFQGCFGGYSAAGSFDIGFVPVFCPIFGCLGIDRLTYNAGLAGWGYAFPFRFSAVPAGDLVYHVPGDVNVRIEPLNAPDGTFSFWGGLGLDFGIRLVYCFIKCWHVATIHPMVLTTAHESTLAAPLGGQTLAIDETNCPKILGIPIEGIPILDIISLHLCEDLTLQGRSFNSRVTSTGASPPISRSYAFDAPGVSLRVRPDAMSVRVSHSNFWWQPQLDMGMYLRLKVVGIKAAETPTLHIYGDQFDAITTPFPSSSVFTLATDPRSPVDQLRYLHHPTGTSAWFSVQPGPTTLIITSAAVLIEGVPLTVRLQESYDGSPIAGQPIRLNANGVNGTNSFTTSVVTGTDGVAYASIPVGEYEDVTAHFYGAETYLPSSARQDVLFVYRPTTFVIWGGNADGVRPEERYQFWGSGWWKQVTGGAFGGNASFQGYAHQLSAAEWISPPAGSGPAPASVADLISVIVTTEVTGRGSNLRGNIARHVLLRVQNPHAYRPDAGHAAWGVMRGTLP